MKLRDVDIIISGTKTGDTYYAKSYPCSDMDKNSKIELYGVPVYYVYIKGTDDKGQSVKYTWKALRFMPYYNPPNFSSSSNPQLSSSASFLRLNVLSSLN